MPIINKTKNSVLADSFEECVTFWQQTRGMMFRKKVVPLVFKFPKEQKVKLHSWFCPGNIDLVFLDENWEVVETFPEWEPGSSYESKRPCLFLLELPAGTIFRTGTQAGDVVHILN
ncbi:MAG: DUF192 domain-containing protein [Candidatus Woesearchaeota archaeon]